MGSQNIRKYPIPLPLKKAFRYYSEKLDKTKQTIRSQIDLITTSFDIVNTENTVFSKKVQKNDMSRIAYRGILKDNAACLMSKNQPFF